MPHCNFDIHVTHSCHPKQQAVLPCKCSSLQPLDGHCVLQATKTGGGKGLGARLAVCILIATQLSWLQCFSRRFSWRAEGVVVLVVYAACWEIPTQTLTKATSATTGVHNEEEHPTTGTSRYNGLLATTI